MQYTVILEKVRLDMVLSFPTCRVVSLQENQKTKRWHLLEKL